MKRKHVVYNTIGASLLLTGAIVGLSGVDLGDLALDQARATGHAIETALLYPVSLPVWAVALLCTPTIWFCGVATNTLTNSLRGLAAWRPALGRPRRAHRAVAREQASLADTCGASETPEADAASPPRREGYFEDALFGVVWRWPAEPDATELSAHCAACDESLVPWANGGSLSRGLHCEQCNKLRAAGEHPDEIFEKVADTLRERKRSGEWRSAPRRVSGAQSAATRPLASLPAA